MATDWSRRTLLGSLGLAGVTGLAGCLDSTASARGATDVVLHNQTANERTVDMTVTGADDDSEHVDADFEMAPHGERTINNRVIMGSDYEVRVQMTGPSVSGSGYAESYSWTDAGPPLHVLLNDQVVFAIQVG